MTGGEEKTEALRARAKRLHRAVMDTMPYTERAAIDIIAAEFQALLDEDRQLTRTVRADTLISKSPGWREHERRGAYNVHDTLGGSLQRYLMWRGDITNPAVLVEGIILLLANTLAVTVDPEDFDKAVAVLTETLPDHLRRQRETAEAERVAAGEPPPWEQFDRWESLA